MERIDRLLWRCVDGAILLTVLGMVFLIVLQVGSRLVDASFPWTEELSRFLFIWTIWLGLAASFRARAHPALQVLPESAPSFLKLGFRIIQAIATVILFSAVSWYGLALLRQQITFGEQSPILQIGMWWATLPLVLGAVLSIIGVIMDCVRGMPQHSDFETAISRTQEKLQ